MTRRRTWSEGLRIGNYALQKTFSIHSLSIIWTLLPGKLLKIYLLSSEVALFYIDNADRDLLLFALENFNDVFLKYALKNSIIGHDLMVQPLVIQKIL